MVAVNRGRRESAQLTFTTGLSLRQLSTRERKPSGTPSSHSFTVRFGSAFDTTAPARIRSPPSRRTPSPGTIAATSTPVTISAPASRAAPASATEIRPMPPRTNPQAPSRPSSVPSECST